MYAVTDPFVLPDDTQIVAVASLPDGVREQIVHEEGDHAVTRSLSRHPSTIVDGATAELLEEFRTATSIAAAIIRYSKSNGVSPADALDAAFPVVMRLANEGILVPAASELARPIRSSIDVGARVDSMTVLRTAQVMFDSEVYLARADDGRDVALKLARAGSEAPMSVALAREAQVLRLLDGSVTPQVVTEGSFEDRPYLAMTWFAGSDAHEAATQLRARGRTGRRELLGLVEAVLGAYAAIHRQGVMHGDVHPRNVIVRVGGDVGIIDFGLGRAERGAEADEPPRGGIDFFMEPELAERHLADAPVVPVDAAAEQYSVAALAYLLLTGAHTQAFSLERDRMLRQLVEDAATDFAVHGIHDLPEIERVLRRALSKDPAGRFASMDLLVEAYRAAIPQPAPRRERAGVDADRPADAVLERVLGRLALDGELLRSPPAAPTASVQNGAAGFALALLHIAETRGDAALLALADVWSLRARGEIGRDRAFVNDELQITPDVVGRRSFYHSEPGVHWTEAAIASSRCDPTAADAALVRFVASAQPAGHPSDLAFGTPGLLVGHALALGGASGGARERLLSAGRILERGLLDHLRALPPVGDPRGLAALGIAHGWGGLLYALLLWADASGGSTDDETRARLDELASLAVVDGRGLRWPHTAGAPIDGMSATWCNGSAGLTHLWALAARHTGEERFGVLTERAARAAVDGPAGIGDLCCGLAGRAYAALAAYKLTNERRWLDSARRLCDQAAVRVDDYALRRDSLYKGDIGVAVLAADLGAPLRSRFPAFEAAGWAG